MMLAHSARDAAGLLDAATSRRVMQLFLVVTLAGAALDLLTKALAVEHLASGPLWLTSWLGLSLIHNTASAGSVWIGQHTWLLNCIGTAVAILLVAWLVRPLSRVERHAPVSLGLVAAGGVGNLVSLGSTSPGVPDFIAFGAPDGAIVCNVADLALAVGLLLLLSSCWRLARMAVMERV